MFKRDNPRKPEGKEKFDLVQKAYITGIAESKLGDFPMQLICDYQNFSGLMPLHLNSNLFNVTHSFTKWLIEAYDLLYNEYLYFLRSILSCTDMAEMNEILEKLKKLLPENLKPSMLLTEDDFKVDFDLLKECIASC